jgi:hypothetical protein
VRHGEPAEGEEVFGGVAEHGGDVGELGLEHVGDSSSWEDVVGFGLGEDRADGGGDHLGGGFGDPGEDVAHEMHPAALPGGTDEHRGDGGLEAEMVIGDDELHAAQPAARKPLRKAVQKAPSSESRRRCRAPRGRRWR